MTIEASENSRKARGAGRSVRALAAGCVIAVTLAPGLGLAASATGPACTGKDAQTLDGFHAAAVLASDKDWQRKWAEGPHDSPAALTAAGEMVPGDSARLMVFFANATHDIGGAHVDCALRVTRPDGKVVGMKPARCFDTRLTGKAGDLTLTRLSAEVRIDPKTPSGVWTVDLLLTDALANRTVPLEFCYHVAARPGGQG